MLGYTLVALAGGLLIGLLAGGRPGRLAGARFRWWPLLPAGLLLQGLAGVKDVPAPFVVLALSYAYLLVFVAANLRHRGMGVVAIGIAMNALVIVANHGMPVRRSAVAAAHVNRASAPLTVDGVKHRLETGGTHLRVLGDIVPVRPLRTVLSFGDLILGVGLADVAAQLTRPGRRRERTPRAQRVRRRRPRPPVPAHEPDIVIDLTDPVVLDLLADETIDPLSWSPALRSPSPLPR